MDYSALLNAELIFTSATPQRQCVNVGIIDDQEVEGEELFIVQLEQTPSQGSQQMLASVTIADSEF